MSNSKMHKIIFLRRCVMPGVDALSDVYFAVADSHSVLHLAVF